MLVCQSEKFNNRYLNNFFTLIISNIFLKAEYKPFSIFEVKNYFKNKKSYNAYK